MKLSIIVPVYNMAAEGKLAYCLDSLVNQTIGDYEIIAVDDASTDNSREVLSDYRQRYPQLFKTVFSPVNKRQGGAKNLGLEIAQGEWIGFIDSDDWVTADFYEKLLAKAAETGADIVGCDYNLTPQHSMEIGKHIAVNKAEQTGLLDVGKYRSLILDGGSLVVKIYRRAIIYDYPNRFPEGIFYEDNAIGNSWLLRAKRFEYLPEPLYYYYQHEASTVHTVTEERCQDRLAAARIMIAEAKEFGYCDEYLPELEYKFTLLFYLNTVFSYMRGVKRPRYGFVKALMIELQEYFPRFRENPYFNERHDAEVQKLAAMHCRSTLLYMCYFRLLYLYRDLRYKG
ncbi:MAG: glycosyltransferase [Lachnospiraceae bacterium]|jgi:glycosyltransferase involved in cell wall biosynthesis|nr:glycosyltransferase [Lachnospiraceae bacterium]